MSLIDNVKNEEVLNSSDEERNNLQTIKKRMSNWIGHILCSTCFLKHVVEGKI
jgi:hypothetical protein